MHILQISSDFCNTKVHENLYKVLSERGIRQTIYCPVRSEEQIGRNSFVSENTDIIYDYVVKPYHRYVYHIKRMDIFRSLQNKVDLKEVDLVHAATLFTDGGQAYKIYKKYHIPYVVAVRNTDINGFLDMLPNTWPAGRKILLNAKMIFFISKALMDKFSSHKVIKPILPEIRDKMMLIPNGIDDYYLDHISHEPHKGHRVLYVGDFSNNKNVVRLCEAVLELKKEAGFSDLEMSLVGGGNNEDDKVKKTVDSHPDTFMYLGPIYDKEKLCEVFRAHTVFAMPSIHETFGLVYLEALSQNLPVVYTTGQGIDGLLDNNIGIGVSPLSVNDIKEAIKKILIQPNTYSNQNVDFEKFRWENIATRYISFYEELMKTDASRTSLLKLIKQWGG